MTFCVLTAHFPSLVFLTHGKANSSRLKRRCAIRVVSPRRNGPYRLFWAAPVTIIDILGSRLERLAGVTTIVTTKNKVNIPSIERKGTWIGCTNHWSTFDQLQLLNVWRPSDWNDVRMSLPTFGNLTAKDSGTFIFGLGQHAELLGLLQAS